MPIPQPIKTTIHFILSIVVINQLTSAIDQQGELLLNQSYHTVSGDNESNLSGYNDNQVFMSFTGGLVVQKALMLVVSWVVLALLQAFVKRQGKNQDSLGFMSRNNVNDQINLQQIKKKRARQDQAISKGIIPNTTETNPHPLVQILIHPLTLALFLVLSTLTIASLQKSLNIIILNTSKHVTMFMILLLIPGLFSSAPYPKLPLFITFLLLTSVSVTDLKTDLLDLYIASWNRKIIPSWAYILDQKLWIPFAKMIISRVMEVSVWIAIYYILNIKKSLSNFNSKEENKNQSNQSSIIISTIQTMKLITNITKYICVLLVIYTIFTGDMLYTIKFLHNNPNLILPLIKLSTCNLLIIFLSYHLVTYYPIYIAFSIIASKSLLPHASHYMLNYIQPLSIPFYITFTTITVHLVSVLEQSHDQNPAKQLQMTQNHNKNIRNLTDLEFVSQNSISLDEQEQVNGILSSQQPNSIGQAQRIKNNN